MNIGVDIDSTIADTVGYSLWLVNQKFGTSYKPSQWISTRCETWMEPEHARFLNDQFADPKFYRNIQPIDRACDALMKIAEIHSLYYITVRPPETMAVTRRWLDDNLFPRGRVICTRDKVMAGVKYDIDLWIEDQWEHAERLANAGYPVLLYNNPWNVNKSWHEVRDGIGIRRFTYWYGLEREIDLECAHPVSAL